MSNISRVEFISFLQDLIINNWNPDNWEKYVVTHYNDPILEDFRRKLVKVAIEDNDFQGGALLNQVSIDKIEKILTETKKAV